MNDKQSRDVYYDKILRRCRNRHNWKEKKLAVTKPNKSSTEIDWDKLNDHIKSKK